MRTQIIYREFHYSHSKWKCPPPSYCRSGWPYWFWWSIVSPSCTVPSVYIVHTPGPHTSALVYVWLVGAPRHQRNRNANSIGSSLLCSGWKAASVWRALRNRLRRTAKCEAWYINGVSAILWFMHNHLCTQHSRPSHVCHGSRLNRRCPCHQRCQGIRAWPELCNAGMITQ